MPLRSSTKRANIAHINSAKAIRFAASHAGDGATVDAVTEALSHFTLDDSNPVPAGPVHLPAEVVTTGPPLENGNPTPTDSLCSLMGDDVATMNHPARLATACKLSSIERAALRKERNNYTKRIRDIFTSVQGKATALQIELEDVARLPTLERLACAKSKLVTMQTTVMKYKRKTRTLDEQRAALIQQFDASQARIDELGNVLRSIVPPEDNRPRQYSNGKHQGQQCFPLAL
jgi:hypothetical protein